MDPKQLLVKTVDAVGDIELRTDHDKLKDLQNRLLRREEEYNRKAGTLDSLKETRDRMEQEVQDFERKNEIESKIRLLKQRREWCLVEERHESAKENQNTRDDLVKAVKGMKETLKPKEDRLREISKKKSRFDDEIGDLR